MESAFLDLLRRRRSVRSYRPQTVEPEKVALILEAARLAPSACNQQPWHIVTVDRPALIREMALCAPAGTRINKWMADAPLVFVLCGRPHPLIHQAAQWIDKDCHRLDVAIAGEHMCLMATELSLGSCWIGWFSEKKIRRLLHIPPAYTILALLVAGYPDEGIRLDEPVDHDLRRKQLVEIVSWNDFRAPDAPDYHS
ncbi:MAG: nitroreductase family protein [Acidobacteria bacterium]|nr:nitroreductase family protein [Acidobacteriota bacterium]